MFWWWPRPAGRNLIIYASPSEHVGGIVYDGDFPMAKYDLNLKFAVTNNGEKHSSGDNSWYGMDAAGLTAMLAHATKAEESVKKSASKGGPLTMTLSGAVTSPDGAPIPPGVDLNKNYSGITRHGLSDIQDALHDIGKEVKKMGRDHATKKEGPKKP